MGKAYWSKSMVVARLTGVPYRQNDLVMDAANGRILIRSLSASGLTITDDSFVQLVCKPDGRLLLIVLDDPKHLLSQHPRYVKGTTDNRQQTTDAPAADATETGAKQRNMVLYARQQVRMACQMHKVKELRCRVKGVSRVSRTEVVAELERVDDMAERYKWGSRAKMCK